VPGFWLSRFYFFAVLARHLWYVRQLPGRRPRLAHVAVLAHFNAERSSLEAEPAGLDLMQGVEAEGDRGKNDNAREYSQHNDTLQSTRTARDGHGYPAGLRSMYTVAIDLLFNARCCVGVVSLFAVRCLCLP
jgi:hypothetical protein